MKRLFHDEEIDVLEIRKCYFKVFMVKDKKFFKKAVVAQKIIERIDVYTYVLLNDMLIL